MLHEQKLEFLDFLLSVIRYLTASLCLVQFNAQVFDKEIIVKWLEIKALGIHFETLAAMLYFFFRPNMTCCTFTKRTKCEKHTIIGKNAVSWNIRQDICIPKEWIPAGMGGLQSNLHHIVIYIPSVALTKTAKMSSSRDKSFSSESKAAAVSCLTSHFHIRTKMHSGWHFSIKSLLYNPISVHNKPTKILLTYLNVKLHTFIQIYAGSLFTYL